MRLGILDMGGSWDVVDWTGTRDNMTKTLSCQAEDFQSSIPEVRADGHKH